jgi:DNA-binding transcriptional regulator YhcF (GntR family)
MVEMITIPKGGRPKQNINAQALLQDRKSHTVRELAEMYKVSPATINRRLREARSVNEK